MITSWEGQRVLVTGASSGIGAAIARDLAGAGATVGLCARRTSLLHEVLRDCRRSAPGSMAWTVDLTELDGLDSFIRRVEAELGGIDVLVNNAGVSLGGDATTLPFSELETQLCINYLSPVRLTLAALPAMQARGSGHVVTISSMAARMSTPGEAAYAGAKAALAAYFEALAGERWDGPVRFHLVYPALIDVTPGLDGDDALAERSNGATPIPAPVCARAIRRQVERDDFELYVPRTMHAAVAARAADVAGSVEFMAGWYRDGGLR